jgi:hypothetical protein
MNNAEQSESGHAGRLVRYTQRVKIIAGRTHNER